MSEPTRHGLNLVGVLVILAIVGIVVALFIPAQRRARFAAGRMQCSNNLRQLMIAMHGYADGHSVAEPPASQTDRRTVNLFPAGCEGPDGPPEERLSWMVALLPYLEQDWLYRRFDMKAGYAGNLTSAQTNLSIFPFQCPEANQPRSDATTHYVALAGLGADAASRPVGADGNGFMGYDRPTSAADIRDGLANTIALMETRLALGPWARGGTSTLRGFDPTDVPWYGEGRPFGGHNGGINVAMADGSVKFVRSGIDPKQLAAAITIAGGEKPVDLD